MENFKREIHNFFDSLPKYFNSINIKKNVLYLWKHFINFMNKLYNDNVSGYASDAALFTLISFFPFAMFFLVLMKYTPVTLDFIVNFLGDSIPQEALNFVVENLEEILSSSNTVISISAISALWSASKGFRSINAGFSKIYNTGKKRNFLLSGFLSVIYTLGFGALLSLTLILLVFGNSIYRWLISKVPIITDIAALIIGIRTTVILFLLLFYFLILYMVLPNRKGHILYELPGSIISSFGWVIFSYIYSYYINNLANFSAMYGSISIIVLLLLWLYFCMYILFIGAEINVVFGKKLTKRLARKKYERAKKGLN